MTEKYHINRSTVLALVILSIGCSLLAVASLSLSVYTIQQHNELLQKIAQQQENNDGESEHWIVRRNVDDKAEDDETATGNYPTWRGAPGRDGRDGKDGKNGRDGRDGNSCDAASITSSYKALINFLNSTWSTQCNTAATTPTPGNAGVSGSTYVRWGRTQCGNQSTLLYRGFAGGAYYTHTGGGVNYQCLPDNPDFDVTSTVDTGSWMYGAEYQIYGTGNIIFPREALDQNVPCARCFSPARSATMMIPGKNRCPESWTEEYHGYLMTSHDTQAHPYTFECVDKHPEYTVGGTANTNGALFYFVQFGCLAGHCPPYSEGWELTCVVCSK